MNVNSLTKLGLTPSEATIYGAVLKLGTCTVRDVSKESGFHRTNIYDVLEQLKEKGLVSFLKEGKVLKYRATDPHNLQAFLQEKQDLLTTLLPELEGLYGQSGQDIQVEVYKGAEGMKASFRDITREGKTIYGFGLKGQGRDVMLDFAQQTLRDWKRNKIKYYPIYTVRRNLPPYYTDIRYVSNEFSSPVATFIYGDKININIWEPSLVAIVIKSKFVAQMYKKHFDLLWKIAKP